MSEAHVLTRRDALRLGVGLMGGALLAGCRNAAERRPLAIANASGGLITTMAQLMRQQRFLEATGMPFEVFDVADGSKILGGIVGGSIDVSLMSGIAHVFPAIERGADLKVIGGAILQPALALYTAHDTITSLRDLEGRVVGSGSVGALIHLLTVALLRQAGVDPAKVQFANIGSSADVFRATVAGKIDAGVGPASFAADPSRFGLRLIEGGNMAESLSQFTYSAAWTSTQAIAERREDLVKALAAYATLYRFVQRPEAEPDFLRARTEVFPQAPQDEHLAEFQFIQKYRPFASELVLEPERLDYLQRLNVEAGSQQEILPFERVADMSLAAEALTLVNR